MERNSKPGRSPGHCRLLPVAAYLIAIVAMGAGTAAAAELYVCPTGTDKDKPQLCDDGKVIALLRQPGGKLEFVNFLRQQISLAQGRAPREHLADTLGGNLSELSMKVHALRSYPNMFVVQFKAGLATKPRLDRLTCELYDVLRRLPVRETSKCPEARTRVQLEPALKLHAYADVPNDPFYVRTDEREQWNLKDQAGIKAHAAWVRAGTITGLKSVRVATLDTGSATIDGELDGDLLVDGADFTSSPPVLGNPGDEVGHGTEVASLIAARANNNLAMAGVTWSGKAQDGIAALMPIRIMGASKSSVNEQCTDVLLDALPYAVDPYGEIDAGHSGPDTFWDLSTLPDSNLGPFKPAKGARVVNLSAGYTYCSRYLGEALSRIGQFFPDVLFVVAVPNAETGVSVNNMDGVSPVPDYPTSYRFDNILSVTAASNTRCLSGKYGAKSVDIAAPGFDVEVLDGKSGTEPFRDSGTSFAAPHVSGAAALMKALAPDWNFSQLRQYLMRSSDRSMCSISGANAPCPTASNWPTICDGITHGLLDLDAATAPPVKQVTALSNSDLANTWSTARPVTLSWHHTFDGLKCSQTDIDLIVDEDAAGTQPRRHDSVPCQWTWLPNPPSLMR